MKVLVAHEGKQHSFKTAEALFSNDCLTQYITTVYDKPFSLTRFVKCLLRGNNKKKCSSRKSIILPNDKVTQYCEFWALVRMFVTKLPILKKYNDKYYCWLHDSFGRKVAKYAIKNNVDAVIMYDTNANSCWKILEEQAPHIKRILDVTIGNRLYLKNIYEKDAALFHDTAKDILAEQKEVFSEQAQKRLKEEISLSQFFLAGSNFVKESLEYSNVSSEKIFVVNYGVDLDKFSFKVKKGSKPLRLLYTGNCSYRKGLHHLLKVVTLYQESEVKLYIAGGYNIDSPLYEKYSNDDRIEFLGFVTHDVLHEVYLKSHVFVLPSLAEGFAMVSLEAMSEGLPVICTKNAGCNDIIVNGEDGFVIDASDEKALKEKIDWFLNNMDKIETMSIAAKNSVSNHSWNDYSNHLYETILKIV